MKKVIPRRFTVTELQDGFETCTIDQTAKTEQTWLIQIQAEVQSEN